MIRLAIFDMDGVLSAYDLEARLTALEAVCGRPADEIRAKVFDSGFEDASDEGRIDADAYLAGFGERIGFPLTEAVWIETRRAGMIPDKLVLDVVARLKARMTVALLTNNGQLLRRTLDRVYPEVDALFAPNLFFSASLHVPKPDPDAYRAVCADIGVEPGEAFFVDDKQVNADGARAAGLAALRFTDAAGLERWLRELGALD